MGDALLEAEKYQEAVNTFQKAYQELAPDNSQEKQTCKEKLQAAQTALKQSKEKNYYKILGVSRTASAKEIKSAYRKLDVRNRAEAAKAVQSKGRSLSADFRAETQKRLVLPGRFN